ncbi:hypothetical protein [Pseudomonas chlororaphis]|uniref:Uncharacterized protein n=1 Tax=Pseudomonas chlororaphis TaxID=587753 RepID=A0A1Q8EU20_9PSED|nr:hypothetical protein [Pseudomonas chlororaphis]OLF55258.1 hypothetical protein BTN82_09705 [Pseudomonas chlororaphis]
MSKVDELAARLKQKQDSWAKEDISADKAIELWPTQVYEMYHQIETWLIPLSEVGLSIRRVPTRVFESHRSGATFNYAIDQLLIEGNHKSILLDPIARFTSEGSGRVEIHGIGPQRHMLRNSDDHGEGHWLIQAAQASAKTRPAPLALNEDALLSVIQEGLEL